MIKFDRWTTYITEKCSAMRKCRDVCLLKFAPGILVLCVCDQAWCHVSMYVCMFLYSQRKVGNQFISTTKTSMTVTNIEIQRESKLKLNCVPHYAPHMVSVDYWAWWLQWFIVTYVLTTYVHLHCRFRLRSQDQVAKSVRIGEYYLSKRKFGHTVRTYLQHVVTNVL